MSNNSTEAIQRYLKRHQLDQSTAGISARTNPDPSLLKPNPHLITYALESRVAALGEAVMVGDSITDIEAARRAGIPVIALTNKSEKIARLQRAAPDALIISMRALTQRR